MYPEYYGVEYRMKVDINAVYGHTGGTPLPQIYTDYAEGIPMGATAGCTPLNPYVVNLDGYQREILENKYKNAPWIVRQQWVSIRTPEVRSVF